MDPEESTSPRLKHPTNSPEASRSTPHPIPPTQASMGAPVFQVSGAEGDDRDRIAANLRVAEARWRAILNSSPNIVACLDQNGTILFINRTHREDLQVEEAVGMSIYALILPEFHDLQRSLLERVMTTGEVVRYEVAAPGAGTSPIYYQGQIGPLQEGDRVTAAIVVLNDITDRRRAELGMQQAIELEQQTRERERLIATIAQKIRQSLDLDQILTTTVQEVRRFLDVERVLIYRFNPDWSGQVITESVSCPSLSILKQSIHDPCFKDSMQHPYRQGRIHAVSDILTDRIEPCYRELLQSLQVRAVLVLPILTHGNIWGLLVAHQCTTPHQWQQVSWHLLRQLSTQVAIGISQAELYQQTQYQAEKECSLNRVIQTIRNSLDLNTIFSTAATEVGRLLKVDRAEIFQFVAQEGVWRNVASYRQSLNLPSTEGLVVADQGNPFADRLKNLEMVQTADFANEAVNPVNSFLRESFAGAWLLVPLQIGSSVWGSLNLNLRYQTRPWQEWEVELASSIADQLAIAIQQSELYQRVQQLNASLESQVHERTLELQRSLVFEALLRRITDKVRDSLDEHQILQSVVTELASGLEISGCDVALYDFEQKFLVVTYEALFDDIPPAQGRQVALEQMDETYLQLLEPVTRQFCCLTPPSSYRPIEKRFSILHCPIAENQNCLGNLWLFRKRERMFDTSEIRLVEQVATQCAIAIRQARLYQQSQSRVMDLERLNQLKDDFLSTVSHELRTPVSNIKMASQMIEINLRQMGALQTDGNTPLNRYFRILQDECQREIELINNLLDLTRLDSETEPLFITTIALEPWLTHTLEPFTYQFQSHNQQLEVEIAANLPPLTTDLSYLQRILSELLTNATKYTPQGERVIVSASLETYSGQTSVDAQPQFLLRITNTGIEISSQELPHIFDRFYRIPSNDPWKHSGTGLGLALVKKMCKRIAADISVTSHNQQVTFTIQLPIHCREEAENDRLGW